MAIQIPPHLPTDILRSIFLHLSNHTSILAAALVSWTWCTEAIPFLYKSPPLSLPPNHTTYTKSKRLQRFMQCIENANEGRTLFPCHTYILCLDLSNVPVGLGDDSAAVTDEVLERLARVVGISVRVLILPIWGQGSYSSRGAIKLITACPNLRTLSVDPSDWKGYTNIVDAIQQHCSRLEALDISGWIAKADVYAAVATKIVGIRKLKVGDLGNRDVMALRSLFGRLEEFVAMPSKISDWVLCEIARMGGMGLKKIVVTGADLTDASLVALSGCGNLKEVEVSGVFGCEAVEQLVKKCSNLERLFVDGVEHPTDELFVVFGKYGHKLRRLHINAYWNFKKPCSTIGDGGLGALANGCPDLQTLALASVTPTQPGLKTLVHGCRKLEQILITDMEKFGRKSTVVLNQSHIDRLRNVFEEELLMTGLKGLLHVRDD